MTSNDFAFILVSFFLALEGIVDVAILVVRSDCVGYVAAFEVVLKVDDQALVDPHRNHRRKSFGSAFGLPICCSQSCDEDDQEANAYAALISVGRFRHCIMD